jgi:hypothetical protein
MCRKPVGDGAKRVTISLGAGPAGDGIALKRRFSKDAVYDRR